MEGFLLESLSAKRLLRRICDSYASCESFSYLARIFGSDHVVLLKRCVISCTAQYWVELRTVDALVGSSMLGFFWTRCAAQSRWAPYVRQRWRLQTACDAELYRRILSHIASRLVEEHQRREYSTGPRGRSWESQPSSCDLNDVPQADRRCLYNEHTCRRVIDG